VAFLLIFSDSVMAVLNENLDGNFVPVRCWDDIPKRIKQAVRDHWVDCGPTLLMPISLPECCPLGMRFARAVMIIEKAVAIISTARLSNSCHKTDLKTACRLLHSVRPASGPFTFFVAGGFVVSEVLGYGDYRDIDLWTQPYPFKGTVDDWVVAYGRHLYPVNSLLVSNPRERIESFDLQICQCAIECQVVGGLRWYQLWMSPGCIIANDLQRCSLVPMHPCIADPLRLVARIKKYGLRGLRYHLPLDGECRSVPEISILPWALSFQRIGLGNQCEWEITVRNNRISGVQLKMLDRRICPDDSVTSLWCEPSIVYSCSDRDYKQLAYSKENVHWLFRAYIGNPALVCFAGGSRVWSYCLLPSWLAQRSFFSQSAVIDELRLRVPCKKLEDGNECYGIGCTWQAHVGLMYKDWYVREEEGSEYGASWSIFMDSGTSHHLDTVMICVDTQAPCQRCAHSQCAPLILRRCHVCLSSRLF